MYRKWLGCFGIAAVATAAVVLSPTPAFAQRWGGGHGVYAPGYGYGSGFASPWNGGFYNNNWGYGNAYPGYYNSYSYYPGGRSNWGYSPGSSTWGNTWSTYPGGAYGFQPSDYGARQFAASSMQPAQQYMSFYGADNVYDESNIPSNAALICVRVAPDAKILFSGQETKERGNLRKFVTPALTDNQTYSYELKAQWNENGQNIDRTRKILVHPGDRIHVDFTRDGTAVNQMTPAGTAARSQSGYENGANQNLPKDQLNRNGEIIPAPAARTNQNRNDLERPVTPAPDKPADRTNQNRNDLERPVPPAPDNPNRVPQGTTPPIDPPPAPPATVK